MHIKPSVVFACACLLMSAVPASSNDDTSDWPRNMTMGTASQGGTYYIYGTGWAHLANETLGINLGTEITGGPLQNATLVQTGDHQFGMVTTGPAYDALHGLSPLAPGLEHDAIRAMFPMYQTELHIIALKRSGIDSVSDLEGKRVGVGPAGGTNDVYHPRLFEALGLDVTVLQGGASDQAGQLQDGLIDAFAFGAGRPISSFSQLENQVDVNIFSYNEAEIETILDSFPELSASTIPSTTYSSLESDLPTVSLWNFAITHKDMPESLVYGITKAIMKNNQQMKQMHFAAVETIPENIENNTFIPMHAGAARWFEENGYEIDDSLLVD